MQEDGGSDYEKQYAKKLKICKVKAKRVLKAFEDGNLALPNNMSVDDLNLDNPILTEELMQNIAEIALSANNKSFNDIVGGDKQIKCL